ncbi:MAG: hypothetical protein EA362_02860 [Saprospirales bacterium]|nr:MAG: hypothetical protein EA362_02860 [Saprospirales bacterium]
MRSRSFVNFLTCFSFVLLISVVGCSSCSKDQSDNPRLKQKALRSSTNMSEAYMEGDFETFIDLTLPLLVESVGGKERMMEHLVFGSDEFSRQNISIVEVNVLDVHKIVRSSAFEHQALISQEMVMQTPEGVVRDTQLLAGFSGFMGNSWQFIQIQEYDYERMRRIVPFISPELFIGN